MAVPAFVQAGTGVVITGASGTVSLTGATAGNLLILHLLENGPVSFPNLQYQQVSNIEKLDGTLSNMTIDEFSPMNIQVGATNVGGQGAWFGRVTASGTCSTPIETTGNDLFARFYEFSGVSTSAVTAEVLENVQGFSAYDGMNYHSTNGTGTSIDDSLVETSGENRLAVNLLAVTANQALAAFAGETGGNWVEPVAEFASASGGTIGIQTAEMLTAGTVNGGTITISSAPWGVTGFALIGATAVPVGYQRVVGPVAFSTSGVNFYTVPADQRFTVRNLYVNNPSGGEIEFTLSVGADAAGTRLLDQHAVAAGQSYASRRAANHTLVAGETIQGFADSTAAVLVIDGWLDEGF